jgi:acyl-CoA synthetase (AMP-forming)/AMP-acid ligase II
MDPLLINGYVSRNARRFPDRIALAQLGRALTYPELDEHVTRLANGLRDLGVGQGDRIAILLGNSIEYVACLLASCRIGAVAAPVNTRLAVEEIAYMMRDLQPTAVVTQARFGSAARQACAGIGSVKALIHAGDGDSGTGMADYGALISAASPVPPAVEVRGDDPAFILYTSGTTGRPKGAILSHAGSVVNSLSVAARLGMSDRNEWRHVGVPMFHVGGVNSVLQQLILGGPALISEAAGFDAAACADLFEQYSIATAFLAPTQWKQVCAVPGIRDRRLSLRRLIWGTSNTPRTVLDAMASSFPGVPVYAQFGQTEMTGTTCTLDPAYAASKLGSVGTPLAHVQLRIVDENMRDVRRDEVGEIVYQGPAVMRGYWENAAATDEAFRGGWFHSGDLGRFDDDGFLYVVDRLKDMIVSGGENIYCLEVETALASHPKVAEVAVVGVPHEKWVETPRAVVVPRDLADPPTYAELIDHLRPKLASYKKPTSLQIIDAMPRNSMGKILRRELKDMRGAATAEAGRSGD